jgi:hypothetical protein
MEKLLELVNDFEKRNNMSIAFTMFSDGSYAVNEFWDNESLDGGSSVEELKTFLIETQYKLDENGRSFSPCIKM